MTWVITPSNLLVDDPDAMTYLAAVEAADGQALESGVRLAVNAFVKDCKADGIWPAIKASCILAGARTLAGALVPLAGTAPTNNNFVSGDYNRKTGLKGDASSKYLNSEFFDSSVSQDNISFSAYQSEARTGVVTEALIGVVQTSPSFTGSILQATSGGAIAGYCRSSSDHSPFVGNASTAKFIGVSRSTSASYILRTNGSNSTQTNTSAAALGAKVFIFARNLSGTAQIPTSARLAFYSIGESLDLAKLDTRVTALITAFGAAIA